MALVWESVAIENTDTGVFKATGVFWTRRAKVPGGWLICFKAGDGGGLTFYPDPDHDWDGNSLS